MLSNPFWARWSPLVRHVLVVAGASIVLLAAAACGGDDDSVPALVEDTELVPELEVDEQPLDDLEPELPPSPPSDDTAGQTAKSLRIDPDGESLRSGSSGDRVERLQRSLRALGFDAGTPDGAYGAQTETAVKSFQRQNGLENDGIAGAQTIKAINNAVAAGIG